MASLPIELPVVLVLFAAIYFAFALPLFQHLSMRLKGRRFTVRLGTPWDSRDPQQRWDVLMSFLSFVVCLALTLWLVDLVLPFSGSSPV